MIFDQWGFIFLCSCMLACSYQVDPSCRAVWNGHQNVDKLNMINSAMAESKRNLENGQMIYQPVLTPDPGRNNGEDDTISWLFRGIDQNGRTQAHNAFQDVASHYGSDQLVIHCNRRAFKPNRMNRITWEGMVLGRNLLLQGTTWDANFDENNPPNPVTDDIAATLVAAETQVIVLGYAALVTNTVGTLNAADLTELAARAGGIQHGKTLDAVIDEPLLLSVTLTHEQFHARDHLLEYQTGRWVNTANEVYSFDESKDLPLQQAIRNADSLALFAFSITLRRKYPNFFVHAGIIIDRRILNNAKIQFRNALNAAFVPIWAAQRAQYVAQHRAHWQRTYVDTHGVGNQPVTYPQYEEAQIQAYYAQRLRTFATDFINVHWANYRGFYHGPYA